MFEEFRKFALRGNVVDMAVGIVIGVSFGTIVKSLVDDVLMPPIGLLLGGVDFSNLFITLKNPGGTELTTLAEVTEAGAVVIAYGSFLNTVISFLIVALAVFLLIRSINNMARKKADAPEPASPTEKDCAFCATSIPIAARRCPHCTSELSAV